MISSSKFQSFTILAILSVLFVTFTTNWPCLAEASPLRPVFGAQGLKSTLIDEATRRRLNSFQICALCTCCGGPKGLCLPSPCCYAINCNIPNRPFGFCAFTPRTCHCFGCHL